MKRKFVSFLLILVLVLSLTVSAAAVSPSEARDSVVVVRTLLETDAGVIGFGHGSGFFVTDQYLVTNYHVIEDFVDYGAGELMELNVDGVVITGRAKVRAYYDSNNYEEAYVVGYDSITDVALLRLANATTKRSPLKLRIPTEDMVGANVYAVGYPGLAENIYSDSVSTWGKNDSTVTAGTISRLFIQSGTGRRSVQIDCDIKGGNSGGPLVDENGAVVGINTETVSNGNDVINYAVNIEEAIQLMNQYQVNYTMYEESSGSLSDVQGMAGQSTAGNYQNQQKGISVGLIVAIAVAAVAICVIVVLVVLLLRKKKPQPAPVVPPVPPAPPAPQKVPTVRSCSRVNYGSHVPVSTQPMMIGRNSICALRFPSDAPGISGNHCSVQWDSRTGDFIVMDMNSTYGTFLMTGQKLTPNVPYRMRSGDKFYLADQNNIIALELE